MNIPFYSNSVVPAETIGQLRRLTAAFYQAGACDVTHLLATLVLTLVQATGKPSFYADTPFGVCSLCGDCEEVMQVDDRNYGVCHEHRVYWYLGRSYLPSQHPTGKHIVSPRILLPTYLQVSPQKAFPKEVCPCCGRFQIHAPWCLPLVTKP